MQTTQDNIKDLQSTEAIEKIKEFIDKSDTGFFCTDLKQSKAFSARPMSVQQVDDQGNLWYLSNKQSHKNLEIAQDPNVQLLFNTSAHAGFLTIFGKAQITYDKNKIEELWEPLLKTWFQGGKDDPDISVIKVTPLEGYYWDNKHNKLVSFAKMAASVVSGVTMDDSIEGKISV